MGRERTAGARRRGARPGRRPRGPHPSSRAAGIPIGGRRGRAGRSSSCARAATPLSRVINFADRPRALRARVGEGIPGSVGGAIAMNAGAHGHSMGERGRSGSTSSTPRAPRSGVPRDGIAFAYRSARFPRPGFVVTAGLRLRLERRAGGARGDQALPRGAQAARCPSVGRTPGRSSRTRPGDRRAADRSGGAQGRARRERRGLGQARERHREPRRRPRAADILGLMDRRRRGCAREFGRRARAGGPDRRRGSE